MIVAGSPGARCIIKKLIVMTMRTSKAAENIPSEQVFDKEGISTVTHLGRASHPAQGRVAFMKAYLSSQVFA